MATSCPYRYAERVNALTSVRGVSSTCSAAAGRSGSAGRLRDRDARARNFRGPGVISDRCRSPGDRPRLPLMPERIDERRAAHPLKALVLLRAQLQVDRGEVVAQLFFGAGADDEARDCRPPEQPGQCDLSRGHAVLFSDLDERIDGVPELVLVVDRRLVPFVACREPSGAGWSRRYLPESRPPANGLQMSRPNP